MADYVVIAILVPMIGAAIGYIIKAKKRGDACIGCSAAGSCSSKGRPSSGCMAGIISDEEISKITEEIKGKNK